MASVFARICSRYVPCLRVIVATLFAASLVQAQQFVRVKRVIDGDTIQLDSGVRVRLIGVNTPETKHPTKQVEYFGQEASAFTKRLVEGKLVRLEFDSLAGGREQKDRYQRTLAYVFLQDGTHVNEEIIKQGYGFAVSARPPFLYQDRFRRLEREAREQKRGLWADVNKEK